MEQSAQRRVEENTQLVIGYGIFQGLGAERLCVLRCRDEEFCQTIMDRQNASKAAAGEPAAAAKQPEPPPASKSRLNAGAEIARLKKLLASNAGFTADG